MYPANRQEFDTLLLRVFGAPPDPASAKFQQDADVWSSAEVDDLRALVARAFSDSLEVVELPGTIDL